MPRASELFTDEHRESVERAIADAETRTSAEIVVVLATRSGRYDRAEDLVGLLTALAAVAAAWVLWQEVGPDTREWETGTTVALGLVPLLLIFAGWGVLGAALASWFPVLAWPFIPRAEMLAEVRRAGFEAFHSLSVGRTAGANGVLLYVSLFERTVWVCADDAVAERISDEAWGPVRDRIVAGFRDEGGEARALGDAVRRCADVLAAEFPLAEGDVNELPNRVHVLD